MTFKQRSGAELRQGSTGSPPNIKGTFQSHASGSPSRQSKGVPGRRPRPHEQGGSKFLRRSAAAYAAGDAAARAAPRYNLPMMDPSPPEPYRSGQRICRLTDLTTNNEVLQPWIAVPKGQVDALLTQSCESYMEVRRLEEQVRLCAKYIEDAHYAKDQLQEVLIAEAKAQSDREEEEIKALLKENEELLADHPGGS